MATKDKLRRLDFGKRINLKIPNIDLAISILTATMFSSCASNINGKIASINGPITPTELESARVNITKIGNKNENQIVEVDSNGYFEVPDHEKNERYYIEALVPGYRSKALTLVLSSMNSIHIKVEKLPREHSKTININKSITNEQGIGHAQLIPPQL